MKLARFNQPSRYEIRSINGFAAVLVELANPPHGIAPRSLTQVEVDEDGRIRAIYSVVATAKLAALST